MATLLRKASVFVLRQVAGRTELLIFEHPTAGLQVPAGTVEDGEDFRAGARRELREESGIDLEVERFRWVAASSDRLPGDEGVGRERHYFVVRLQADEHLRETWSHAADGHIFQFKWAALDPRPELVGEQSRWLARVLEKLGE